MVNLKKINADGSCDPISLDEVPYWSRSREKELIYVQEQGITKDRIEKFKRQSIKPRQGYRSYPNVPAEFGKYLISKIIMPSMLARRGLWFYLCVIDKYGVPYRIVFWFPEWPGLNGVSKTFEIGFNRGVMLFPAYPNEKSKKEVEEGKKDWSVYASQGFILTRNETGKCKENGELVNGNTFIALSVFVNYDKKQLSFFSYLGKIFLGVGFLKDYASITNKIFNVGSINSIFGEKCFLHTFNVNLVTNP